MNYEQSADISPELEGEEEQEGEEETESEEKNEEEKEAEEEEQKKTEEQKEEEKRRYRYSTPRGKTDKLEEPVNRLPNVIRS